MNLKTTMLRIVPYVAIALLCTKLGQGWRLSEGATVFDKLLHLMDGIGAAFQSPMPSFHPVDLCVGLICGAGVWLAVYIKGRNAKKYRKGAEYGSARWGTSADIQPFIDPDFQSNVLLTRTERLTMNSRPKNPAHARNKNVLVIGGSGSGKTRFFILPNLLQCHSSYVVTDPKADLVVKCGRLLLKKGYRVKFLNTINFSKSMHYNPFSYIHSEKDILKLVTCLIANTQGEGKGGDPFWTKAETLLFTALIGYIHYEAPKAEQNFAMLIDMLNVMDTREDDEDYQNPVDLMFEQLERKSPQHFAVRQYKKYKLAAGMT